jgi:hypothetical protein
MACIGRKASSHPAPCRNSSELAGIDSFSESLGKRSPRCLQSIPLLRTKNPLNLQERRSAREAIDQITEALAFALQGKEPEISPRVEFDALPCHQFDYGQVGFHFCGSGGWPRHPQARGWSAADGAPQVLHPLRSPPAVPLVGLGADTGLDAFRRARQIRHPNADAPRDPDRTRHAAHELGGKADSPDPYESLRKFTARFR